MLRWEKETAYSFPLGTVAPLTPLMFEPGSRWQYGTSADWSGRLVETVSGLTLEQYFQKNILGPLGMHDTSFIVQAAKFDRMVSEYTRQPDGTLKENPRVTPASQSLQRRRRTVLHRARLYSLYSDVPGHGKAADGAVILQPKTVDMMATNPNRRI